MISRMLNESRPLLWIGGPFTSINEEETERLRQLIDKVAFAAWKKGWSVISVHKNCKDFYPDSEMGYEEWMISLSSLIRKCDTILMMPGYDKSKGCMMEIKFANQLCIPVYVYETDGIPEVKL